jgi:hypothetical protein
MRENERERDGEREQEKKKVRRKVAGKTYQNRAEDDKRRGLEAGRG